MKKQRTVTPRDRLKNINIPVLFLLNVLQENKIVSKNLKNNPTYIHMYPNFKKHIICNRKHVYILYFVWPYYIFYFIFCTDLLFCSRLQRMTVVSVQCMCDLMTSVPHFNFCTNILTVLVPWMNDKSLGEEVC